METQVTVKITKLNKRYNPSAPLAVDNLSLVAYGGEIIGIMGQNGAGKTTTLKMMTGMIPIDSGEIELCGYSIKTQPTEAKAQFGFVSDNHAVFDKMTGIEYVNFMADIYRVDLDTRVQRLNMFQDSLDLGEAIYNEISSYSHGMKQKIAIMGALIHFPKLWILDEPMTGLDPQTTYRVKELMFEHKANGNTVLFSSHNIDAVEKLCDRVYIVSKGKLIDQINMNEFRKGSTTLEDHFFEVTHLHKRDD
ncbi:MAG: ABC transporter ATP-binding protein [Clostridia bacterium]|nr:ABC transporter ATP-binding protein [Clostridia bacterium]